MWSGGSLLPLFFFRLSGALEEKAGGPSRPQGEQAGRTLQKNPLFRYVKVHGPGLAA